MTQKQVRAAPRRHALRVLVADDPRLVLDTLVESLTARGVRVVASAADGQRAVELAREYRPDVAVLAVTMPVMDGLEAARLILQAAPRTGVILLTGPADEQAVLEGLRIGARGFVVKAQGIDELVQAIDDVGQGSPYLSTLYSLEMIQAIAAGEMKRGAELSPREWELLKLVAEGKSSKQAAAVMSISPRTAESHRAHLKRKLDIHDTPGLVLYAIHMGLIAMPKETHRKTTT